MVTTALVVSLFFFDAIFDLVIGPYHDAQQALGEEVTRAGDQRSPAARSCSTSSCSGLAALVFTSPFWLYQIWAFILPGLHSGERKWSRVFAAIAGPLFLAGVVLATSRCPRASRC